MSEDQNRGIEAYSRYDTMETEELEEILRLDSEAPEGQEADGEEILYILGVLAQRKKYKERTGKTAQEAYESFKQNYLPEVEEELGIVTEPEKQNRRPLRWLRGLAAAAAVLVFVFLGSITADALGFDIWKAVGSWAKETFHFESGEQSRTGEPDTNIDLPYSSLEEAIYSLEKTTGLVPTWIPDGYELYELDVVENPLQKNYIAVYQNSDINLKIVVKSYLGSYPEQIEQSDGFIEVYGADGIEYYFFANYDQIQAVWVKDSYECYITGKLTIEELKLMIDSIEKG